MILSLAQLETIRSLQPNRCLRVRIEPLTVEYGPRYDSEREWAVTVTFQEVGSKRELCSYDVMYDGTHYQLTASEYLESRGWNPGPRPGSPEPER